MMKKVQVYIAILLMIVAGIKLGAVEVGLSISLRVAPGVVDGM